ncbi:MAG: hypothetical protein ACI9OJ_005492, partial [Myxococcota bacterium]
GAPTLAVSTDKPLYRPGQTIYIRSLALARTDQKPLAERPITIEVRDGKNNVIFREESLTDEFGIAGLTAPLATQVNLLIDGRANWTTTPADDERGLNTLVVYDLSSGAPVGRQQLVYVRRPLANVTVSSDQPSYWPGAEATLKIQVKDPSGVGQPAAIGVSIADEAARARIPAAKLPQTGSASCPIPPPKRPYTRTN